MFAMKSLSMMQPQVCLHEAKGSKLNALSLSLSLSIGQRYASLGESPKSLISLILSLNIGLFHHGTLAPIGCTIHWKPIITQLSVHSSIIGLSPQGEVLTVVTKVPCKSTYFPKIPYRGDQVCKWVKKYHTREVSKVHKWFLC